MKPEVEALIARGNITQKELADLRCNTEEWNAIVPKLDDEAFAYMMQHCIDNTMPRYGTTSYIDALVNLYGPEAIRRIGEKSIAARDAALEEAAHEFRPGYWLCMDHGGDEGEEIQVRIRALKTRKP